MGFREREKRNHTKSPTETIYKWVEGSCVQNYATSALKWTEYTGSPDFITKLSTMVADNSSSNEERAVVVENFIL